jgi:uncharacterized membrane protein
MTIPDRRDAWLYVAIALPVAILFAFLTPPFQSPDEVAHYWRANAIARGQFVSARVDGKPSAVIPTDARDLVATLWMELAGTSVKFDRTKFDSARQLRPRGETVRLSFPAFYTAVPYTPQTIAIFAGRLIGVRTLYAFYAGRVMNAIAGVLLVMLAMRLLPEAAWVFGSIGLTPMFLYLAGTFSADVVTCGLAFCATAAALRPGVRRAAFPLFAALLSLAKPGYALIALIAVPRLRERKERLPVAVALAAAAICGWVATTIARAAYYPLRNDVVTDASAQIAHVAAAPVEFVRIAAVHYVHHAWQYFTHLIGRLGWLDIGLPRIVYVAYAILLLYVALSVSLRIGVIERVTLAIVFTATLLVLALSQYLVWSPVGGVDIEGLQGRYFLPIVPLALLTISARCLRWTRWAVCLVTIPGNTVALYIVATHYW